VLGVAAELIKRIRSKAAEDRVLTQHRQFVARQTASIF
jgi:hypothetical protein